MGMNKYDRMLHILNLLRTRRNLNAQSLARECEVTERSIYRDIISLSEINVPIYYDNGYKLASDNFLPPLNFSFDEYHLLRLALESSPLIKTSKYKKIYKGVRAKIENCLSDNVKKEKKFAPETTRIDISLSSEQEKEELFYSAIENAITSCNRLKIKYDSINSGLSERKIDPYFIIFRGRAFYFVAFCHLRNEFRTFRIDRVIKVEALDEPFFKKDNIDPKNYFDGSWNIFSGEPVEVIVKFKGAAAKIVSKGNHHPNETIQSHNGNEIIYTVVTKGIDEIQRWILSFGSEAEVLAPETLKENLLKIGRFLTKQYKEH